MQRCKLNGRETKLEEIFSQDNFKIMKATDSPRLIYDSIVSVSNEHRIYLFIICIGMGEEKNLKYSKMVENEDKNLK